MKRASKSESETICHFSPNEPCKAINREESPFKSRDAAAHGPNQSARLARENRSLSARKDDDGDDYFVMMKRING